MDLAAALDDPRVLKWALGLAVTAVVWLGKRALRPYERMPSMLVQHVKWFDHIEEWIVEAEKREERRDRFLAVIAAKLGLPAPPVHVPAYKLLLRRQKDLEWELMVALGKTPGPGADKPRKRWTV